MVEEKATEGAVKIGLFGLVCICLAVAGIAAVLGYGVVMAVKHFLGKRKAKKEQAAE